jgi:hypothetical protein
MDEQSDLRYATSIYVCCIESSVTGLRAVYFPNVSIWHQIHTHTHTHTHTPVQDKNHEGGCLLECSLM